MTPITVTGHTRCGGLQDLKHGSIKKEKSIRKATDTGYRRKMAPLGACSPTRSSPEYTAGVQAAV